MKLSEPRVITQSIEVTTKNEEIMKIPPQAGVIRTEPLFLLGYVLPDDLKEKTKGLWEKNENFKQGFDESFQISAGEVVVHTHEHDHSPIEEADATLDIKQLKKEDMYRLIGTYIDVLRAFPRVESA